MRFAPILFAVLLAGAAGGAAAASLLDAVRAQDAGGTARLLADRPDVTERSADGTTALHWAAYWGDPALVERLLAAGADPRATNDYGATPMSEAAERGDARMIRALLKAGADVESPSPEGQTALMTVARTGSIDAAQLLIKAGAAVDARERWRGQTALMWAAAQGQPGMVRLLVRHGADVNAVSEIRQWPRKVSAEPRPQNRPSGGLTPLLLAAREGCADCARALVEGGADINLPDPDNISPLLMAVLNARFDTAKYLIDAGANIDKWDTWGRAPLYSAVDYNTTPRGGRPDRPSADRTTALDVIGLLLAKGANPNMQLNLFPPYRSLGQDRGGDSMLTVGTTPLIRAAKAGDLESVRLLLEHKALPDLPNALGITPFMAAAGVGSTTIDTRARFRDEARGIETARLLLVAGANRDAVRDNGQTALHGAALWGWNGFVQFLADGGARLDVKDRGGATPLDIAMGKAGSTGRAGVAGAEPHPETEALLRKLLASQVSVSPRN
jgi:ankyrin repeat protein